MEPQVLMLSRPVPMRDQTTSVVVALHNPDTVEALLNLACPIARQRDTRLIALSIVEVPRQIPIHEGMRFVHHKESLLNHAKKCAAERGVSLETDLVIAHHAYDGILAAVDRHRAEALVMGWKGHSNTRDRIFGEIADRVIRHAPCDILLFKSGEAAKMENCLFPTAGGPNAKLASTVLNALAKESDLDLTAGYVLPESALKRHEREGMRRMEETLTDLEKTIACKKELIKSKTVAGGIASASRSFDLVVIGAAKEPFFRKMLFGEIPEKVARYSPTSVLLVKRYEGVVKSLLKKIMG